MNRSFLLRDSSVLIYVTKNELTDKIKEVWLSAFSERVLEYRKKNGLSLNKGIAGDHTTNGECRNFGCWFWIKSCEWKQKRKIDLSSIWFR